MIAARDRTKSAVPAVRAYRRAVPIGMAGCALVAGVLLLGNPLARNSLEPAAAQPEVRLGTAELSLPEPVAVAPVPTSPNPTPAPVKQSSAPAFVIPPGRAPAAPAPAPPAANQRSGGKRAAIIVETLPAKPIIPPFTPKQPLGATPEPRPTLPLDTEIRTEIGTKAPANPLPASSPAPKTAAVSLPRDG